MKQGYEAELGALNTEYHNKHQENDSNYAVNRASQKATYMAKMRALLVEKSAKHDALFVKYDALFVKYEEDHKKV